MSDYEITREQLHAYLDDALNDVETARIERVLRTSEDLRNRLNVVREERDRGEHSVGGIWRSERLSCPTRPTLSDYLLECVDAAEVEYIKFHLTTIACPVCLANLEDLQNLAKSVTPEVKERQKRYFESSAGLLPQQQQQQQANAPKEKKPKK